MELFARNSPINVIDRDGRLTISALRGAGVDCGGWVTIWQVTSDLPPGGTYWYVQEITFYNGVYNCSPLFFFSSGRHFYEAKLWTDTGPWLDEDSCAASAGSQGGLRYLVANAKLFSRSDALDMVILNWGHQASSGSFFTSQDDPDFWSDPASIGAWELGSATRLSIRDQWDCCCDPWKMGNYRHVP